MKPPGRDASEAPWLTAASLANAGMILEGHRRTWGSPLLALRPGSPARLQGQELFATATVVLAHDGSDDPRLIYANKAALALWRRDWPTMVGLPSRLTAEPAERQGRAGALAEALRQGGIAGYGGIRIDSEGRRFRIAGTRLWSLRDGKGKTCGQAACFASWWWI